MLVNDHRAQDPLVALTVFHHDLAVRKIKRADRGRAKLVIVHRYGTKTSEPQFAGRCFDGEEVQSAWIVFRGESYHLRLSTTHLLLFDYLCRFCRRYGQTAAEIEAGLNENPWYTDHALFAKRDGEVIARSSRTAIKKQVERIRKVMAQLFAEEHLPFRAEEILCSLPTSTRQVRYSINADVTIEH